jgi:site-specific DNA recombinase
MEEQTKGDKVQAETIERELTDIGKQIGNIISAITQGFASEELKVKMEELSDRKASLETKLKENEVRSHGLQVTEEQVRNLFSMFRGFVKERNIPECKKFINNYVDKVIVYKDRVEVIFSVVFSVLKEQEAYKIRSAVKKSALFKMYGHTA